MTGMVSGTVQMSMVYDYNDNTFISYDTGRDAAPSDAAHVVAGPSQVKTEHYVYEKTGEDVAEDP